MFKDDKIIIKEINNVKKIKFIDKFLKTKFKKDSPKKSISRTKDIKK